MIFFLIGDLRQGVLFSLACYLRPNGIAQFVIVEPVVRRMTMHRLMLSNDLGCSSFIGDLEKVGSSRCRAVVPGVMFFKEVNPPTKT